VTIPLCPAIFTLPSPEVYLLLTPDRWQHWLVDTIAQA
jgi:hypothetical protein